jgi:pyruvate-formate lyase
MIDIEDVIKAVALKNNQAVEKDDPIMALITIMAKIAEDWQATMDASLEDHLTKHEEMAARWRKNTPAQVNKVLDAAIAAGKETMAKSMSEGAEKVMAIVREREQRLLHEIMEGALQKQKAELAAAAEAMAETFKRHYLWMLAGNVAVMLLVFFVAARF